MILDNGVCAVYKVENKAAAGNTPQKKPVLKFESWYGELLFENTPRFEDEQAYAEVANRIRIPQNRMVSVQDVVTLGETQYGISRVYHGRDDDNGALISDISLYRLEADYDLAGV